MLLDDIKKRIKERSGNQLQEIEQAIAMLEESQQKEASIANELMLESLKYRKYKVEKEM